MTFGPAVSMINAVAPQISIDDYNVGDVIVHRNYGKGEIIEKTAKGKLVLIRVRYDNGDTFSYDLTVLLANNMIAKLQ